MPTIIEVGTLSDRLRTPTRRTLPEPDTRCFTSGLPRYVTAPEPLIFASSVFSAHTLHTPEPLTDTVAASVFNASAS